MCVRKGWLIWATEGLPTKLLIAPPYPHLYSLSTHLFLFFLLPLTPAYSYILILSIVLHSDTFLSLLVAPTAQLLKRVEEATVLFSIVRMLLKEKFHGAKVMSALHIVGIQ